MGMPLGLLKRIALAEVTLLSEVTVLSRQSLPIAQLTSLRSFSSQPATQASQADLSPFAYCVQQVQ